MHILKSTADLNMLNAVTTFQQELYFQVHRKKHIFTRSLLSCFLLYSCRITWAVFLCFRVCLKHRRPGRVSVLCWTVEPLASTAPVLNPFPSLRLIPIMWVLTHIGCCTSRVILEVPVRVLFADIRFPQIVEAIIDTYIYIYIYMM
jgi:hypothetical protein